MTASNAVQLYDSLLTKIDSEFESALSTADLFERFFEENKSKLKMAKSDTYPRDEEAIEELVELARKAGQTELRFAELIAFALTHISFSEFYETLCKNAYEVANLCVNEERVIHLVIPYWPGKSNTWCSLLVWPIIRPYVVSVSSEKNIPTSLKNLRTVLVLVVDDALYSGIQMTLHMDAMKRDADWLFPPAKSDPATNQHVVGLLVAASTSSGRERVLRYSPIVKMIGSHTKPIRTVLDALQTLHPALGRAEKLQRDFATTDWAYVMFEVVNFGYEKTLVYFDHKMPGGFFSTNHRVLSKAPFPIAGNMRQITIRSLIKGCPKSHDSLETRKVVRTVEVSLEDDQSSNTCPPAFYKSIQYTTRGEKLVTFEGRIEDVLKKI